MKSKILIVAAFAVLMFTGCCSTCKQRAKNQLPLCKTEWHLVQIEGVDKDLKSDSFNIVLSEEGFLSGVAACNRLLGKYESGENQALRFVNVGSTMMLCPENDDLERKFLEVLNVVSHYDIDGDVLMLLSNGSIKALLKGMAVECKQECGECDHKCEKQCDKACEKKCEKACDKKCDHKCEKQCEKVADCAKKAECHKATECKKAECAKKAECHKGADCTKKAECKKAAECKKGACPKAQ